MLDALLTEHGPFDIVIVDPAFAYLGGDSNSQKDVSHFMRELLNPLLQRHQVGLVLAHHTNKPLRGRKRTIGRPVTMPTWARGPPNGSIPPAPPWPSGPSVRKPSSNSGRPSAANGSGGKMNTSRPRYSSTSPTSGNQASSAGVRPNPTRLRRCSTDRSPVEREVRSGRDAALRPGSIRTSPRATITPSPGTSCSARSNRHPAGDPNGGQQGLDCASRRKGRTRFYSLTDKGRNIETLFKAQWARLGRER